MPTRITITDHTVPWPVAAAADYRAKGYWAGVPLGTLLREVADRQPDAPALVDAPGRAMMRAVQGAPARWW